MRLVDDFIFISHDKNQVQMFLERMHQGLIPLKCSIIPKKKKNKK